MAKIIDIKTGKEIHEIREYTSRELADKLYEVMDRLTDGGYDTAATQVRHAICKIMPAVVRDKRARRMRKQAK